MDMQERRQDHFNKAYLGVIAQGECSGKISGKNFTCMYLSPTGSKCAVGHILSEQELKDFGGYLGGVKDLWMVMGYDEDHPFYSDYDFYNDLQDVHDTLQGGSGPEFVMTFKYDMRRFAERYKLTVPDETAVA